jgi:hypothetical protein
LNNHYSDFENMFFVFWDPCFSMRKNVWCHFNYNFLKQTLNTDNQTICITTQNCLNLALIFQFFAWVFLNIKNCKIAAIKCTMYVHPFILQLCTFLPSYFWERCTAYPATVHIWKVFSFLLFIKNLPPLFMRIFSWEMKTNYLPCLRI